METMMGTVNRVVFKANDSDFKIFHLKRGDNSRLTVQGEFPELLIGSQVEIHGKFHDHPKYGASFKTDAFSYTHNNTVESIKVYIQSIAKWIGPERSAALAMHFGEKLEEVIEKEPQKLLEVEGIGAKVVDSLVEAWTLNRETKNLKIFMQSLGLSTHKVKDIINAYGPNAQAILTENPFLLSFNGFGFSTCDSIASKLRIDPDNPLRYKYFILYALKECLSSGHLYLTSTEVVKYFNAYNKLVNFRFKKGNQLVLEDIADYLITLKEEGFIYTEEDRHYELYSFLYENESAKLIAKIMDTPAKCKFDKISISDFILRYEQENSIILSAAQKDAIESFVKEKITIVTGSAGTGKTTILKAFVELMQINSIQFELLTPTGISAKKLSDTTHQPAYTIHRRLGFKGHEWSFGKINKYMTQVVIVDEVSMVDMEVFYRMISALYPYAKLVLVGDHNQLPSVGPGNVLRDLIHSKQIKTILLTEIFRQAAKSEIIAAANKIKDGNTDLTYFRRDKKAEIWFIPCNKVSDIEQIIINLTKELKDNPKMKEEGKRFQVITPRNTGPLSVDSLNIILQEVLNPKDNDKPEVRLLSGIIRKGDRVLIRKNNYDLGVFNGDLGKVIQISPGHILVEVEDFTVNGKRTIDVPIKIANDLLKLGFSMTCHKMQGLEATLIIMPFVKLHGNNMLQRNLLYTAITRAKKKVIVIGQASAIQSAIMNDRIQKRNTRFAERIKEWIGKQGISLCQYFSAPESCRNAKNLKQLLYLEEKT
jgi:exodeoxyribonuclease V alpha subunit